MRIRKKFYTNQNTNLFVLFDLNNLFHIGCIAATLSLQILCVKHYFRDEDVSSVHFTKFDPSNAAIYPSISICILPPFLESKFDPYEEGINQTSYLKFLQGDIWDERMLDVNYDNVTVSLVDNMFHSFYWTQEDDTWQHKWEPNVFVSFRSSKRKCFTIDAPIAQQDGFWIFGMYIRNDIFPEGIRSLKNKIFTYIHFLGQRFTSYYTVKTEWGSRENKSKSFKMNFRIKNIDVITNRNKGKERCIENWKDYDQYIMNDIMVETGCHPPHWISKNGLPVCSNSTQMKKFADQPTTAKVEMYDPPCKIIERLDYTYDEKDMDKTFG